MARHTLNRHGLVLHYDDNYFFMAEDGTYPDFRAIVSTKNYHFDQISPANVHVMTPAQQLVWNRCVVPIPEEERPSPIHTQYVVAEMREGPKSWLDRNAPGWSLAPTRPYEICERSIFLARVGHARAFIKHITAQLAGIRIE